MCECAFKILYDTIMIGCTFLNENRNFNLKYILSSFRSKISYRLSHIYELILNHSFKCLMSAKDKI